MTKRSLAIALLVAGCGSEPSSQQPPAPEPAPLVTVQSAVATAGTLAAVRPIVGDRPLAHSMVARDNRVFAASADRLYEVDGDSLVHRALFATDDTVLADVRDLTARAAGGSWIASEHRLFALEELYVVADGLDLSTVGTIRAACDAGEGPLQGLWLGTSAGVYRRSDDGFVRIEGTHVNGSADRIVIDAKGQAGLVANEAGLFVIEAEGTDLFSSAYPETVTVHDLAAGNGVLFAATDAGLIRWRRTDEPKWTRFDIGTVAHVAANAPSGVAWFVSQSKLHRLIGDSLEVFEPSAETPGFDPGQDTSSLSIDSNGDAWLTQGMSIVRVVPAKGDDVTTFETDLKPWIVAQCAACHSNATQDFTDYDTFTEIASDALARVERGDMPRCGGGLRCEEGEALGPAEYEVLVSWIREGRNP